MPRLGAGLAQHLVGGVVLESAARLLGEHGIPLMTLKGVWLQRVAYADSSAHSISDVDVLVSEPHYEAARAVLAAAGWQLRSWNVYESSYRLPGLPLPLDLHRCLFARMSFRMPTAELFARGREDRVLFGTRVILPDPLDGLAHIVGHFVKARGYSAADPAAQALWDVPLLAARCGLDPRDGAARLEHCGMARAARYALPLMAANDPSGFCLATVRELESDPLGSALARAMRGLRSHCDTRSLLSVLPGALLEPTLSRGLAVVGLRLLDKKSERVAHCNAH